MTAPMTREQIDAVEDRHRYDVELGRWGSDEVALIAAARYGLDLRDEYENRLEGQRHAIEVAWRDRDAARATIARVRAYIADEESTWIDWSSKHLVVDIESIVRTLDGEPT